MLRLLSSKAQGCNDFLNLSKPCHVGFDWMALDEYSQMSAYMPGFRSFLDLLHHFVLAKLDTRSIRVSNLWTWLTCILDFNSLFYFRHNWCLSM